MGRKQDGLWVLALCATLAAIVLFPVYWIGMTSILPTEIMLSRNPPLLPPLSRVTFDAYPEVFARKPMLLWLANSVTVVLGTLAVTIVAAAMAGYSLSRYSTKAQQAMGFRVIQRHTLTKGIHLP